VNPVSPTQTKTRRSKLVWLGAGVFLLFAIIFMQAAFNLTPILQPENLSQTLLFAVFSGLIVLGLIALTIVLLRTLAKLYLERQAGVLGSRFRTKMVLGALVLSFGPVIALFVFSYGLMNRSIDRWFSRPVEEVRERTAGVTSLLAGYAGQNVRAEADAIAHSPDTQRAFKTGAFGGMMEEFRRRDITLQDGFAVALYDGSAQAMYHAPASWHELQRVLPIGLAVSGHPHAFPFQGRSYMLAASPVNERGMVLVAMPLPAKYSDILRQLEESERQYITLRTQRKLVRQTYMQFLLLITLLVLFASTWFALFLSKLVTKPVSALAEGTHEISKGNLGFRVEVDQTEDELGKLVDSFNEMATELESNRQQITENQKELAQANVELEQRRHYIETILESIPSGVLSLDANGNILRLNAALLRMFRHPKKIYPGRQTDLRLRDIFDSEVALDLERILRKSDRLGTNTVQMEINGANSVLTVGVTVAAMPLGSDRKRRGYVVVFDDVSEVLRAQRQVAWREVARRIAHEIKNPLTPITLSAERIRRHLGRGTPDEQSLTIIEACAETIEHSAETVRTLVDEFSTLARFPQPKPQPTDINQIVETALAMFDGRLDGITVTKELPTDLPMVMADPEGIKRVVSNLVDNAAEAMQDSILREIHVTTSLVDARDALELTVSDTGHGVTPELKEKLFLPYFSTKQRGTGLGLAIVSRIIEDHHGTIRVEENKPVGTKFIVELPVMNEDRTQESQHREQQTSAD
jgi:two-component system, NtrC family, nitrogen regulation sensor histidine kinase NtrY